MPQNQPPDVDEFLAHFGIKGMKWGVRRDLDSGERPLARALNDGPLGRAAQRNVDRHNARQSRKAKEKEAKAAKKAAKKVAKAERKEARRQAWVDRFDANFELGPHPAKYDEIVSLARQAATQDVMGISNHPKYKNADLTQDSQVRREYYAEIQQVYQARLDEHIRRNASGTRQLRLVADQNFNHPPAWKIEDVELEHVDGNMSIPLVFLYNDTGHIIGIDIPTSEELKEEEVLAQDVMELYDFLCHTDPEAAEEILQHYGVKGMKWGVRREREDLSELSDDDLRKSIERMRLEKQYKDISGDGVLDSGRRFVAKHGDRVFGSVLAAGTTFFVQRELKRRFSMDGGGSGPAKTAANTIRLGRQALNR